MGLNDTQGACDEKEKKDEPHADTTNIGEKEEHLLPSRKPKWWRQIAGRRATKGQRGAISRMDERGYVIKRPPHGAFLPLDFADRSEL